MIWLVSSFLLIFLYYKTHKRNFGFRESLVLSFITCNILVYASTHLLSLARSLTARNISLFWIISFMLIFLVLLKSRGKNRVKIFPALSSPLGTIEIFLLSVSLFFCLMSLMC